MQIPETPHWYRRSERDRPPALADAGTVVVVADIELESAEKVLRAEVTTGVRARGARIDVADAASVRNHRRVRITLSRKLYVLSSNAGIASGRAGTDRQARFGDPVHLPPENGKLWAPTTLDLDASDERNRRFGGTKTPA